MGLYHRKRTQSPEEGGIILAYKYRGKRRDAKRPKKKTYVPKKKRLNLRKIEEFKFEMSDVLEDLDPTLVGTIKGSIIAKADRIDINAATDFILEKEEEGLLTSDQVKRLGRILNHYSFYR